MSPLSGTLTLLSDMFAPAVLVSACGSLILTQHLWRVRLAFVWFYC